MNYAENHPARTAFKRKLIETDLGQLYLWLSGIHVRPAANRHRLSCPDRIAERSTDYRTNMGYCYRLDCRRFNPAHDFQISGLPAAKYAGFEFVAENGLHWRPAAECADGFFHDNSVGDITATVTTDLNFLENYSMHILDKVTTGVLSMIVMAGCILAFDWRIGLIFVAGILLSFPIYSHMQKKGKALSAKRQKNPIRSSCGHIGIRARYFRVKSFNMCDKNLSDIEDAYESNAAASYGVERVFTPLNMTYSMVFRISACMIMLCAGILAVGGDLSFANLAVILIASFTIFNPIEVMGQMTTMIRTMDAALDRVERIKQAKKIDENGRDIPLDSLTLASSCVLCL